MPKLLLTTVFKPFGIENKYNKKGDEFLLDYLASRLTREPGLFPFSSFVPHSSLHLIAANLPVQSVVFEYPSLERFIEEVKKGYDYVGISFMIKGFRKTMQMIALVHKHSPKTKVIIGGFGTALHDIDVLGADYVSKGEGVSFMRKLLGFSPHYKPVQPLVTVDITLKVLQDYDFIKKPKMGLITSGFGCPNACEFCSTSAYYGHNSVPFLKTGRDIYEAMLKNKRESGGEVDHFLVSEEDMMLYRNKVMSLGKAIQEDQDNDFNYGCFASISSISNYDIEELAAMGVAHIWIGIESYESDFKKREGRDIHEVFNELHSLGITTTGSSVFGLDHHTPEKLPREVDFVISLAPTTVQLSNLMPSEGTPLRRRLEKEKRIKKVGFKDADLYSEVIQHPNFESGSIVNAIFEGYDKIYEALGPSIFRIYNTWFTGYQNLKKTANPHLKRRAALYKRKVKDLTPLLSYTTEFLPNDDVRSMVEGQIEKVLSEFGALSEEEQGRGEIIGKIFALENAKKTHLKSSLIEPETLVTEYGTAFS